MGKHAIFLLPQQCVFIFGQLPQLPFCPLFPMFPGLRQLAGSPGAKLAFGRGGRIGQQLGQIQPGVIFLPAVVWLPIGHPHNNIFQFKFRFQHTRIRVAAWAIRPHADGCRIMPRPTCSENLRSHPVNSRRNTTSMNGAISRPSLPIGRPEREAARKYARSDRSPCAVHD